MRQLTMVNVTVKIHLGVQRGTTCARTPGRSSNTADESIVITILAVAAAVAAISRSYAPRVFPDRRTYAHVSLDVKRNALGKLGDALGWSSPLSISEPISS
ncbi:hypothetical protein AB0G15_33605 [Streptosporangium sp. NPDC023825]|uniref:hypothetical protein n=1 Tax=Streptosporangium sp. NPDC023825 TaxID=3154909 RepID=UPI003445A46F